MTKILLVILTGAALYYRAKSSLLGQHATDAITREERWRAIVALQELGIDVDDLEEHVREAMPS